MRVMFKNKNNKMLTLSPTRLIVSSFVLLILAGTMLLNLPIASNDGKSIGFFNALFTATSASCVTGLIIVDTLTHWSLFGQLVILSLVQIGGLGLATLATFFSVIMGRKVALREMIVAKESINYFTFEGVAKLIKNVVIITFSIELIGALLLSISFVPRFGARGFYLAAFNAISAFCNAGVDIMGGGKSLTEYNNDPFVLYIITCLIIIGGLGFMVWKDLYEYRKNKSLYLHTKVVLVLSLSLIIFGTALFLFFEHNNPETMGNLTPSEKINSAVFHSVSTRTAGYHSLPVNDMKEISKVATIILMFIGAAPGSTGGGIKVTTFGVVLMAIISQIKGSPETIFFKRRVPHYIVGKALAIIGLSIMLVVTVTTILLAIEDKPFITILYEVTSAFSTVGLSTGIIPDLHNASKALLILTMFLGRVGPLTFAIALTLRANKKRPNIVYPEGKIVVG